MIDADAYVKSITDVQSINRQGSVFEDIRFDLERICSLVIDGVDVIGASRAEQMQDVEPFLLHGIDATQDCGDQRSRIISGRDSGQWQRK
ncbi:MULTISPECIES: hypothetical protein [Paraburkholderia]|uniref:hypothetical protein n=1 Tax=Paraburkholderia TaxID=1822464 RepID=UPI000ACDB774|nr:MULTISPECIES: hypothetical protein [Paraburkholderia]MBK5153378.1 hypothetical protein [Burkholderia sp. R-69608]MBK5186019.1 hypothetical protein [Burkholderia sp. R-69749]